MKAKVFNLLIIIILLMDLIPFGKVLAAPSMSVSPTNTQSAKVGIGSSYLITITNTCSEVDLFNITYSPTDPNWSVQLLSSDNSTPLTDLNGDSIPDTGNLQPNESANIYVKVTPNYSVCNNSQYQLTLTATSTNGNCGGSAQVVLTTTAIHTGNLVVTKSANPTDAKVGDTVTWTIHIKNTGDDPIANVSVSDTLGAGCAYTGNFSSSPSQNSGDFPSWSYSEIPPGSDYVITFTSTITGCSNADNTVSVSWGNNCQTQTALASVKIIPTTPNISFTPANIAVPYCSSTSVLIPITNNGDGFAKEFKLKIDKIPSFYSIQNVDPNWSYDSNTGEFTYIGGNPQGAIPPNGIVNLSFDVAMPQGSCDVTQGNAILKFIVEYKDPCGNLFYNPSLLGSISVSGSGSYFDISKTGPRAVDIGQTGLTYTINITYHKGGCNNDSLVTNISDTLPDPFIPNGANNGGTINGQTVTWSNVTFQDGVPQTFTITFDVTSDPCYAHNTYTNEVTLSNLTDCCGCPISGTNATYATYINDPASTITDSSKSVDYEDIEVDCSTDTNPYTNPSGNPDDHNNRRYTVEYDFNTGSNAPSSWSGIIFRDELNNNQFTNADIANILVEVDSGLGFQQVSGWVVNSYVPLEINLSGLNAPPPNTGLKLRISFTARATRVGSYVDWSSLEIPGFPRGCSLDPKYYEGIDVSDYRAELTLATTVPQTVEKCATYDIPITLNPINANVDHADLTVSLNGFTYVQNSTTYSNNGNWCSGTKGEPQYDPNTNTLTWNYSQLNEIYSSGTITIKVKKDCTNNTSINVLSNYKDNCSNGYQVSASSSAYLIKSALLYSKITPQNNFGYSKTVDWKFYITNGGDGTAREVLAKTTLGSGLSFNSDGAYVKIGNTTYSYGDFSIGWPTDVATGTLTWDFKELSISPSSTVEIYFKTDISSCSESNLTAEVFSSWCSCQESNHDYGQVRIPSSYALTTIESADVYLCGNGSVVIKVSNIGTTHVYNAKITVDIPKYLKYSPNSSKYSYNGGAQQSANDPQITQILGGDYAGGYELVWDVSDIPELSDLSPSDYINLTFNVEPDSPTYTSCDFFRSSFQKVKAYSNFAKPCNSTDPTEVSNVFETNFTTHKADLAMTKMVVNIDGTDVNPAHYFPRELNSTITFEVGITNNGDLSTLKTNFADVLTGTNQHPLDYVSAQYSYDGGTWTNVPWDSAPPVGSSGSLIWNNIESDLGQGIEPGKALKIRITATVDSLCTSNEAYNYSELWTGCSDLTDMNSGNLISSATGVPDWNGALSTSCPIYQAKYSRVMSHRDSWAMTYKNNIPDYIPTCAKDVVFEIEFDNGATYEGGTTIYAPLAIYDVIPQGATYVSGSTEFMLPGAGAWTAGSDPTISTVTFNSSHYGWNGNFTQLEWNSTNNATLGLINISPGQSIRVRFKLDFGNCSAVMNPIINRQRLSGYDCNGSSGTQFFFPYDPWWNTDYWQYTPEHAWVKVSNKLSPNIEITKSVDKSSASPGDTLLYEIHLRNTGNGSSDVFSITDQLPPYTALVSGSITDGPPPGLGIAYSWMEHTYDSVTNTITWFSSSVGIAYDDITGITGYSSKVDNNAICLSSNCSPVGTAYKNDGDYLRHTANNAVYDDVDNSGDVSSGDILLAGPKEPVGTPFVAPPSGMTSDPLRHYIDTATNAVSVYDDVDNDGTVSANDIIIKGPAVPIGTLYSPLPSGVTTDPLKHTEHGVPAGADTTLSFRVVVSGSSGYISNQAKFTDSCCYTTPLLSNLAQTHITATPIKVEKDLVEISGYQYPPRPYKAQIADLVRFRIKVRNLGNLPVYNVDVYDALPTGWEIQSGTSRYALTNGSLPSSWTNAPAPNTSPYQTPPDPPPNFNGVQWHIQQPLQATDDNGGSTGGNLDTLYLEFVARITSSALGSPSGEYNLNSADISCTLDADGNQPVERSSFDLSDATEWVLVYKPQLVITKVVTQIGSNTSNTTRVEIGETVKYKITVTNTSSFASVYNVDVTDTLPTGFSYKPGSTYATWVSWSGSHSSTNDPIGANPYLWDLNAEIKAGESLTITFEAVVTSSANLGQAVNTSTAQGNDGDGALYAATAPDSTNQAKASVVVYKPVLRVTKVADLSTVSVGSEVTFTIKVENLDSYASAYSVDVVDTLPSNWNYVSNTSEYVLNNGSTPTSWNPTTPTITGNTLTFDLNETINSTDDQGTSSGVSNDTLWIRLKANPTNSAVGCSNVNTVLVNAKDGEGTSIPSVSDSCEVCVCSPKLAIEKFANKSKARINESVEFTIKVINKNPVDAFNVDVFDYLPNGWIYENNSTSYALTNGSTPTSWTPSSNPVISDDTLHFDLNLLIKGSDDNGGATGSALDTLFVKFSSHPTSSASYGANTNRAVSQGEDSGGNLIGSPISEFYVNVLKPDVTITKVSNVNTQNVNGEITYTITATNNGNEDLINATIIDTLPDGVTFVSSSGGTYTPGSPATVKWSSVSIQAGGGSWVGTITVKVNKNIPDNTLLKNSVTGSGSDTQGNPYNFDVATSQTEVLSPNLVVSKESNPNPVKAGQNLTYTITILNNGSAPANGVVVTDNTPVNTTFVSARFITGTGSVNTPNVGESGLITYSVSGQINAGDSVILELVVQVKSPINDNTHINNTATIDSSEQGPINASNDTIVSSLPNLTIAKSDSEDPIKQDRDLVYTISYANTGTMNLTNLVIVDTLPSGVTYVSSTPSGSLVGNTLTWNVVNLPAGSSANITVVVHVNSDVQNGAVLINQVSANSDQVSASTTEDTTVGAPTNLTISKSDSLDPVQAGDEFSYTIVYQNTGGQDATNVVIEDTLPSVVTFISETHPNGVNFNQGPPLRWTISTLPAGSSGTITITVKVPLDTNNGLLLVNTATIKSSETNPVSDLETTLVKSAPNLVIDKTAQSVNSPPQAKDTLTYSIKYGNTGNLTATNTVITDHIPSNTRFVVGSATQPAGVTVEYSNDNGATWSYTPTAGGDGTDPNVTDIRWNIGILAVNVVNQEVTFKVVINSPLPDGTVISNTAKIQSNEITTPISDTENTTIGSAPNLHITKTAPSSVNAGDTITYTIEYWNDGNMNATGVVITESYDPNVEFVSSTPNPDNGTNNQWTIGTIESDAVHHAITVTVRVKAPTPNGTVINNTVTIDSDQTNPLQSTAQTTVGSAPTLTIYKIDTQDPVQAGENIIYTITVGNTGNANATNVAITDTTPPNTTFVSARFITKSGSINNPGVGNTGTITWTLTGALAPNEEFAVELIVKVNSPLDNGTVIHNTAHVSCVEDSVGKDETEDTTIQSSPTLSIDKVDLNDPVQAGDNITYHITVTNSGNMNAHSVVITDEIPQNTTFVSASFVSGGAGSITDPGVGNTGTVQWNLSGTLNALASVVVELVVKTNSPLPDGTVISNTAKIQSNEITTPISDTENTTIGSAPALTITKTDSPDPVQAGDSITYTITVTNTGNMNATQFVISDEIPINTTFVSARFVSGLTGSITAPPVGGNGTVTWTPNPDVLPVGATVVVELVVKTANSLPSGTIITNSAYTDSKETQRVLATIDTTISGVPILKITKTAYPIEQAPGEIVIYSINYSNTGNSPATNVVIEEAYPSEVDFYYANPSPTSGNNIWIIPTLNGGESGSITVVVKVKKNVPLTTPPLKVTNTVNVKCNESPQPVSAEASFEVKAPGFWDPLLYRKEVNPKGSVYPGVWLTYTNYYGNNGNAPATNVVITDVLDSNLDETTLIIYNGGTYNPSNRTITWVIPVVQPQETGSVSFKVMVRRTVNGMTLITNTSYIKSDQTPEQVATNTVYNTVIAPCPPCIVNPPTPPTPPTPSYSIDISFNEPETICASSFSKFVLTFTNGVAPYEYSVDFGDGTPKETGKESGNFISLIHTYNNVSSYTVSIEVKDANKKVAKLTKTVEVKDCTEGITIYHQNFMIGYPDNTIRPERNVTRAEIAAMLLRALGINATILSDDILPFNDIPITHWAYNFTRRVYQEGLMEGDTIGKFRPDDFATRAEVATILARLRKLNLDDSEPLFSDVKHSDWFNKYVNAAVKAGLITGYPDKTFKPNGYVTRAEFAAMFERALFREDIPLLKNKISGNENILKFKDLSPTHWAYYIMLEAFQPHLMVNASKADVFISVKSKTLPVYIATLNSKILIPKLGSEVFAIVPADGMKDQLEPKERNVFVKIINKETP
ncbi:MAG: DUF11 domain-containing protein [Caldisericaceae bacterium]